MNKTKPGTRALIREYLRRQNSEELFGILQFEEEISKRIGGKNSVLLDGKIISAHKGEIVEGKTSYWISVSNRISLDNEDDKMPTVLGPLDNIEEIEEQEVQEKEK
jgi:hypothetical protein